jgi:hypothetical protein
MRKLAVFVCGTLVCALGALAQDFGSGVAFSAGSGTWPAAPRTTATDPGVPLLASARSEPPEALLSLAEPAPAAPDPSPAWGFGLHAEYRWQLSLSYAYVRFRSAFWHVNQNGIDTTLVRFFNNWLGVEGAVTAAFGGEIPSAGAAKYMLYGGGARIAGRNNRRRLEPWGHALVGGTYVQPQAPGSRSGLGLQAGGGVDWRWMPRLSLRGQGDWTHTHVFGAWQNNFEVAAGPVFNFNF